MVLDFGKLNAGSGDKQTEPRKIFTTLMRNSRFKRPLDEQADVLDIWYERRESRDLTIKMNTGAGKTVVGLLCLQSSLNEGIKPAVYIAPDNFLTHQTLIEAEALGIKVTENEKNPDFLAGHSILVINVHKLVNARSVFGVGETKIAIGCIVIDDAHACLEVVHNQFSIKSTVGNPVYDELLHLFEEGLKVQSRTGLMDIQAQDPNSLMAVPYWAWQSHQDQVLSILHKYRATDELKWSWQLMRDCIPQCTCVFGGGKVEISPRFIPIERITAFDNAQRRIYMTATLADDTILASHFKADTKDIATPIKPKGGGDIGDRMILAPQEINPEYTLDEIKSMITDIASECNVVVIVPSRRQAVNWQTEANQILDAENIQEGVQRLKNGRVGLTVLINKYDGIDLPGKACELLIIDGLPEVSSLGERIEMAWLDGTKKQLIRQIQRIEQGMGRGVRSSDDYCAVLLLGGKLTQRLHEPEAENMFSSATRAQINLGKRVTEQVRGKPLEELRLLVDLCLKRDEDWIQASRNAVVNAPSPSKSNLDESQVMLRKAFDAVQIAQNNTAINESQEAVNSVDEKRVKGYFMQQLAEHTNRVDPAKAQELQLKALSLNNRLLRPLEGIVYHKLNAPPNGQAAAAAQFIQQRFLEGNDLIIWIKGLLEDLNWGEEGSKRFEAAMQELGRFLGFGSERPEVTMGVGPDNLWALGKLQYLVIECKSGAVKADKISKHDTNQLNGSIVWFEKQYDKTCTMIPIMVHQKTVFEHAASPDENVRIINIEGLTRLLNAVHKYSIALANSSSRHHHTEVNKQLSHHKLLAHEIVGLCTVSQNTK